MSATQFARALGNEAALLPFITPLGELDESADAALFSEGLSDFTTGAAAPVAELERRLLLARLINAWAQSLESAIVSIGADGQPQYDVAEPFLVASSPAGAYALAADLGALIDELHIEEVSVGNLNAIVDADFDRYWSITTRFLDIALKQWPEILAARRLVDAVLRRKALIDLRTANLTAEVDGAPVIALGSTGTQPATARLIAAIAARTNGTVILPGLDLDISEKDWACVGATEGEGAFTHPQTMLKRLLGTMRVARAEVRELGVSTPERKARRRLIAMAMAPAEATSDWLAFRATAAGSFDSALEKVSVVEAPDERLEAPHHPVGLACTADPQHGDGGVPGVLGAALTHHAHRLEPPGRRHVEVHDDRRGTGRGQHSARLIGTRREHHVEAIGFEVGGQAAGRRPGTDEEYRSMKDVRGHWVLRSLEGALCPR